MILVEVVDKIPEALLVLLLRPEEVQVDLEVPLLIQLPAYVAIKAGSRLEIRLKLFMPTAGRGQSAPV